MGGQSFMETRYGSDVKDVWKELKDESYYNDGHKMYNGGVNTCSLGRCTLKFDKPNKTNEKKAMRHIEDRHYGEKWVANYIDLGIVEYRVVTIKKVNSKNNPSYKLQHAVYERVDWSNEKLLKAFDTKTKADNFAVEQAIKNPNKDYYVSKEYVLQKGDSTVTRIKREVKTYKSKPKLKPQKNRIILPIHKYIFYGWASC